ncbi:unnamed protein product [Mycena citricolor]|uniref:Uncharacterized protein n=1 Tax=Mycena citricolor TaxID=2018698 RepID=A0AAD2K6A0_9AGAR|nr:unnamed protein product [Mycena citricolor]
MLEAYRALFERSCDAITAFAAALRDIYSRCGFEALSSRNKKERAIDPFRSGITQAVQWYSNLSDEIGTRAHAHLEAVEAVTVNPVPDSPLLEAGSDRAPPSKPQTVSGLFPGRASQSLREACPACFGGGDVQLGGDGCMGYRHLCAAGDSPIFFTPKFFVPEATVRQVQLRIAAARKQPPKRNVVPAVPPEVLDACEQLFKAAKERDSSTTSRNFDSSGVFVLAC